jgi:hypothetical protein
VKAQSSGSGPAKPYFIGILQTIEQLFCPSRGHRCGKFKQAKRDIFVGSFQLMDDDKCLADFGLTSSQAKAQTPAEVGLAFMMGGGSFEELEKTPYSNPPELPDVMKPGQESTL